MTRTLSLIFLATTLTALTGCGPDDSTSNACGEGESRTYEGQEYCLYRQGIQETGFSCPAEFAHEHTYGNARVCTQQPMPPEGLEKHVVEEVLTPPNKTTNPPNNNTMNPPNNMMCSGGGGEALAPPIEPTDEMLSADVNVSYTQEFTIAIGEGNELVWSISGDVPPGLELIESTQSETSASLTGTPTTEGTYMFEVRAEPAQSSACVLAQPATMNYTLTVSSTPLNCGPGEVETSTCLQCGAANGCDQVGRTCAKTCNETSDCGADFDGICESGVCWMFQCG